MGTKKTQEPQTKKPHKATNKKDGAKPKNTKRRIQRTQQRQQHRANKGKAKQRNKKNHTPHKKDKKGKHAQAGKRSAQPSTNQPLTSQSKNTKNNLDTYAQDPANERTKQGEKKATP